MGFLDRFKAQPKWKHPDSAVRAAAVEALSDEEQDLLRGIAVEDPDPAVRRTALARLTDVATLARLAREDGDGSVRAEASELVAGIARDSTEPDEALAALAGLTDSRELALVARAAELEPVALAALEKLSDDRVVAVVARQATHANVRLAALGRLTSADDMLALAIKSEHKDVAVSALDRLTERAHLELVATRARNKAVARRARAQLRAMEEADRVPQQQAARRQQLCELVEGLLRAPTLARAEEQLASASREWDGLGAGADAAVAARFAAAVGQVRDLLAKSEAERAEHERRAQALAEETAQAVASRVQLVERIDAFDGDDVRAFLDEARTVWVALAPWPDAVRDGVQARALDDRFARACAACEKRVARRAEAVAQRSTLEQLLAQAEQALAHADLAAARAAFVPTRQAWQKAVADGLANQPLLDRWHELEGTLVRREVETREARAKQAMEHLARVERLVKQLEALASAPEVSLKDAERLMREARATIEHPGYFPTRQDHDRLVHQLKEAQGALFPRVQELRDAEDWRRWANAGVQEDLCKRAEALKAVEAPAEAAKLLRELQQEWKKVGSAPRDQGDELWRRFKAACDEARGRLDGFFGAQREQEAANLRLKESLCERAEALADSTDWIRTAEELKRLQAEWQKVGPVPHEQARVVWQRFRGACDRFFTRRKEDLVQRKRMWAENLTHKEAICVRAEELAGSTDWEAAGSQIKRLQVEWKAIGPVKPSRSEAIWQRFRTACDTFFERYKHRDEAALSESVGVRETLCKDLETLGARLAAPAEPPPVPPAGSDEPAPEPVPAPARPTAPELQKAVLDAWAKWQQAPRVPWHVAEPFEKRFESAVAGIVSAAPEAFKGTRLDVEANVKRMEDLCTQVEGLATGRLRAADIASAPPETIATLLKDALAANTLGGRADEEARRRSAAAAVKDAQAAWRRLGPVPGERGRLLAARFNRACRRVFDQTRPAGAPAAPPPRPTPA
jgi:hypothetical protein